MKRTKKTFPAPTRIIVALIGQNPEEPSTNLRISSRKTFRIMRAAICEMMTPKWHEQSVQGLWECRMLQALMKFRAKI